jgi:hypothetical protein
MERVVGNAADEGNDFIVCDLGHLVELGNGAAVAREGYLATDW